MTPRRIDPVRAPLEGEVRVPGDKSISHRYALLGGMADGTTRIRNFASSEDCRATLSCIEALGAGVVRNASRVEVHSPGWRRFTAPRRTLDVQNSGTTIRLLSALLAAGRFSSRVQGDSSLNQRPMQRIMEPLIRMGARIEARDGGLPPLLIRGGRLTGIRYRLPIASAQVKSCVLLAGLMAEGETEVEETGPSRDHTERALPFFGAPLIQNGARLRVRGGARLHGVDFRIPGDFSSALFFLVAGLLVPGSRIALRGVGVNPTRAGFLSLLEEAGIRVERSDATESNGEPVCDLQIHADPEVRRQFPNQISGDWVARLIDEIPALAILGTSLERGFQVRDAQELRHKESDRIHSVVVNLRELGVDVRELPDGFVIPPGSRIRGGQVRTFGDHRIAMAFALAGLVAEDPVEVDDPDCVAVSYPDFFQHLEGICRR
ncbi:MAG: 3-phosphoshikimate 1-carboxyvinyltransferase [Acidobacteriota bacterium]|nr:3-phosphoshikimate 1-carboxyvinyltransferase [Acidobacteriota bacterium]